MHVRVRRYPAVRHSAANVAYFHPSQLSIHDELIMAYSIQREYSDWTWSYVLITPLRVQKENGRQYSVRQVKRLISSTLKRPLLSLILKSVRVEPTLWNGFGYKEIFRNGR